ncbi:3-oxoacyl-ACP reductase FabG [Verminephrobacter eiseniae]|uniref:3-oxoacyl-ACP reductase FabG n=1 Tax=Verminephrobacter eiseniae TaxID=364317 RepID=UPI0010E54DBD|nr:3-oxoacyl-ACP reductase FabG [Verminephrobacter eiseniae]KAB7590783.1 3-oxoacyl-ACP reductase FabG [Verminephrobacter sp. Larva24]MCW5233546.1 3-oxoacyl-ACP reductase FabG [Verminephrobacter eiseniae]MCW5261658.1 3-oxoacyl-ACP reductase FabG [Verminephrobacter eiseniae]MCW5294899.1 3-oxoacyl-ACP reductase FabG [Verminephrobacter eiseniae]MCW8183780.1 3-oxoacyl-ACP reductase FabG [Verminephrobacter eiseniae]
MLTSIKNKSVLITGATSGIGLGMAKVFGRQQAKVAITGRTPDKVKSVAQRLGAQGMLVRGFVGDVANAAAVSTLMEEVAKAQGGIDILCCNAGVFPSAALGDISAADWDLVLDTNAKGSFLCVQSALPYLRQAEYGRIILTSSITGPVTGYPGWAHYAASKAAQLGFMRTAAIELAQDNITINAVLPGNILTEGLAEMGRDYISSMAASIPLKRLGAVEDIGNAALFFASREAGFITGQTLIVDGGQTLPESL